MTARTGPDRRDVGDPLALRALAHPLRWEILELLLVEGSATATRCAEALGVAPNSCSYHLRLLAKYGFVERARAGDARQRPWRLAVAGLTWARREEGPEGADAVATDALDDMLIDLEARRQHTFLRDRRSYPEPWRRVAQAEGVVRWMTPAEARALNDDIRALLARHGERHDPGARPVSARPVRITAVTLPMAPT